MWILIWSSLIGSLIVQSTSLLLLTLFNTFTCQFVISIKVLPVCTQNDRDTIILFCVKLCLVAVSTLYQKQVTVDVVQTKLSCKATVLDVMTHESFILMMFVWFHSNFKVCCMEVTNGMFPSYFFIDYPC